MGLRCCVLGSPPDQRSLQQSGALQEVFNAFTVHALPVQRVSKEQVVTGWTECFDSLVDVVGRCCAYGACSGLQATQIQQ